MPATKVIGVSFRAPRDKGAITTQLDGVSFATNVSQIAEIV